MSFDKALLNSPMWIAVEAIFNEIATTDGINHGY